MEKQRHLRYAVPMAYTENTPALWRDSWPAKKRDQHKYNHGHAVLYGAPELTGATHLAAWACARMGTGLVTVIAPNDTAMLYRAILPAHILVRDDAAHDNDRTTARLYGPGGISQKPDYNTPVPIVLDADALYDLPPKLAPTTILTPHQGEFDRAFPTLSGPRPVQAQEAARLSGAFVVLKGPETVIAAPDGRLVINRHASPWLATAGSGDVLAGMITGLIAQKMPLFEACCSAVWLHGDCAQDFGPGLVAADLPDRIPHSLQKIL